MEISDPPLFPTVLTAVSSSACAVKVDKTVIAIEPRAETAAHSAFQSQAAGTEKFASTADVRSSLGSASKGTSILLANSSDTTAAIVTEVPAPAVCANFKFVGLGSVPVRAAAVAASADQAVARRHSSVRKQAKQVAKQAVSHLGDFIRMGADTMLAAVSSGSRTRRGHGNSFDSTLPEPADLATSPTHREDLEHAVPDSGDHPAAPHALSLSAGKDAHGLSRRVSDEGLGGSDVSSAFATVSAASTPSVPKHDSPASLSTPVTPAAPAAPAALAETHSVYYFEVVLVRLTEAVDAFDDQPHAGVQIGFARVDALQMVGWHSSAAKK